VATNINQWQITTTKQKQKQTKTKTKNDLQHDSKPGRQPCLPTTNGRLKLPTPMAYMS